MQRRKLKFIPRFEGPIEGWAKNYITKNRWRVEDYIDFDDLMQDAYEYFLIVRDRYPDITEPKHFMALFKRCLSNHFHDLSKTRTRHENTMAVETSEASQTVADEVPSVVAKCPQFVEELALVLANPKTPSNVLRKTTNEYWCGLVGVNPDQRNIREEVRTFFLGA